MRFVDEQINKIKEIFGVVSPSEHHKIKCESREIRGNASMDLRLRRESVGREFVSSR